MERESTSIELSYNISCKCKQIWYTFGKYRKPYNIHCIHGWDFSLVIEKFQLFLKSDPCIFKTQLAYTRSVTSYKT